MRATSWKNRTSPDEAARRAAGRRRYNAERQALAQKRRNEIKEMIGEEGIILCGKSYGRGKESQLAIYFGVHRSTICRDIEALRAEWRAAYMCRICRFFGNYPLATLGKLSRRGVISWDGCTDTRCAKVDSIADEYRAEGRFPSSSKQAPFKLTPKVGQGGTKKEITANDRSVLSR